MTIHPAKSAIESATCTLERQMLLVDTIAEKMRVAMDEMPVGHKTREREFYNIWCLLMLTQDNMKSLSDQLDRIVNDEFSEGAAA